MRLEERRLIEEAHSIENREIDLLAFDEQFRDGLRHSSVTSLGSHVLNLSLYSDEDVDRASGGAAKQENDLKVKELVRGLLKKSLVHSFYKSMQRFANIYYGQLVVSLVIILSIMSNTLFSLGYVVVLCLLMYQNQLFLNVSDAKTKLVPFLQNLLLPYMIVEMTVQLAYQLPIDAFDPNEDHNWPLKYLPTVLGLHKYYVVKTQDSDVPVL